MEQRIICHDGICLDATYPSYEEELGDGLWKIEYEMLRKEKGY
jgi:hypothetical protein